MAQATPICPTSFHLCRERITALNADGTVADGPNNSYVTDSPVSFTIKPNIRQGESKEIVNGCGCVCVQAKTQDILLRFDLEADFCALEPGALALLTGATIIGDDSDIPVPKGLWFPNQQSCVESQLPVAFEAWTDTWIDDHQGIAPNRYIHWLFPMSFWQLSDLALGNDLLAPKVTGYTVSNAQWDVGPYGDQDEAAEPLGGFFWTDSIPDPDCALATISSS